MADHLSDRLKREIDPARLRTELSRLADWVYKQGISEALAIDHANAELDRLRAENERLRRGARELSVAAYACGAPGIGAQLRELAGASDEEVNDG